MGRPPSVIIKPGMIFGDLKVVMKVNSPKGANTGKRYRLLCQACGTKVTIPSMYLLRKGNPKTHCGCRDKEGVNKFPREKGIWHMMHRRCYFPTHVAYRHYGGATPPVEICERWRKTKFGGPPDDEGWNNFIADMGGAPGPEYSIDRQNPFKSYTPENCKWATDEEQMSNQKKHWKKPDGI